MRLQRHDVRALKSMWPDRSFLFKNFKVWSHRGNHTIRKRLEIGTAWWYWVSYLEEIEPWGADLRMQLCWDTGPLSEPGSELRTDLDQGDDPPMYIRAIRGQSKSQYVVYDDELNSSLVRVQKGDIEEIWHGTTSPTLEEIRADGVLIPGGRSTYKTVRYENHFAPLVRRLGQQIDPVNDEKLFPNRNPEFKPGFYKENKAHDVYQGWSVSKMIDCGCKIYQCKKTKMITTAQIVPYWQCALEALTFDTWGNTIVHYLNEQAHEQVIYYPLAVDPKDRRVDAPPLPKIDTKVVLRPRREVDVESDLVQAVERFQTIDARLRVLDREPKR